MIMFEGPYAKFHQNTNADYPTVWSGSARGIHYGQACQWTAAGAHHETHNTWDNMQDPAYAPYTPPYFYGESVARVTFTPHKNRDMIPDQLGPEMFSIKEIVRGATIETIYEPNRSASYANATVLNDNVARVPGEFELAGVSKMQVNSSINLFGRTRTKEITYSDTQQPTSFADSSDESNDIWVISPKFETPHLNFSSAAPPYYTRGMWMQSGTLPARNSGIYLSLRDVDPPPTIASVGGLLERSKIISPMAGRNYRFGRVITSRRQLEVAKDVHQVPPQPLTQSLLEVCGFASQKTTSKKKLGKLADSKVISEAIVAIPFAPSNVGPGIPWSKMSSQFFKIPRRFFHPSNSGITNNDTGPSINDMVDKMKKYVIPPHMDFVTNYDIHPFVMYIFEFEHTLDKEDLKDIWQNIMPKIAMTPEKDESVISHRTGWNEFFGTQEFPEDMKWMVFKVKRRAEKNYFAVTADSTDDSRFKFEFDIDSEKTTPDYSYNWPYDFFSLIELVKMEAQVDIREAPEPGGGG